MLDFSAIKFKKILSLRSNLEVKRKLNPIEREQQYAPYNHVYEILKMDKKLENSKLIK